QGIMSLSSSSKGGLWFCFNNEGSFGFYDGEKFLPIENDLWKEHNGGVISIKEIRDGALWVGTSEGTARWVKDNFKETFFDTDLKYVSSFTEDSKGRVWIGTTEQGLFYWQKGTILPFPDEFFKKEKRIIFCVVEDQQGNIWVGTQAGLRCYNPDFTLKEIPPFY